MGEMIWVPIGLGWLAYGLLTVSVPFIISGSLAALTSGAIALLIWGSHAVQRGRAVWTAVLVAAVLVVSVVTGVTWLSLVLATLGVVQFIPQIVESLRLLNTKTSANGVSPIGAAARACYTLGWTAYGLGHVLWGADAGHVDLPLVTWGVAGAIAFATLALAARGSGQGTSVRGVR